MADMADIFSKVDKGGEGVCVQVGTALCARPARMCGVVCVHVCGCGGERVCACRGAMVSTLL